MKWITPFALMLALSLFAGCGGDDNGTDDNHTTSPRLIASAVVSAPSLTNPDDALWAGVDSTTLTVSGTNTPKHGAPKEAALPTVIHVQAAINGSNLYMRARWADPTHDAYPGYFTVTQVGPLDFAYHVTAEEDQLYVMFQKPLSDDYDVWNWQALRTAGVSVGRGMFFENSVLTADTAGGSTLIAATENLETTFELPLYLPRDSSEFHGAVLSVQDVVPRIDYLNTGGWTLSDTVPGWLVDTALTGTTHTNDQRGSLWDLRTATTYDNAASEYRVVFRGPMASQYSDDLNLSTVDSVQVIIGIFDDQNDFNVGGTHRAFSQKFWLIFP